MRSLDTDANVSPRCGGDDRDATNEQPWQRSKRENWFEGLGLWLKLQREHSAQKMQLREIAQFNYAMLATWNQQI
jgi:hypothetical protein